MLLAVAALIAPVAYVAIFSGFYATDDEGYFLVLFRDYLAGRPLLGPTTPVYGPFFFETLAAVFRVLGLAPGQDTGRTLTLVLWLLTGLLGALATFRLSRNLWLAIGAQLVTFHTLADLTHEPMSPQALIALLLVALAATATLQSARPRFSGAMAGGIVAALCLTKINVGLFAGVAVVVTWCACLRGTWRRVLLPAALVGTVLLPLAVTFSLLTQPWVAEFAIGMALTFASLGVVLLALDRGSGTAYDARWVFVGGAAVTLTCLTIAIAEGTSLSDVWNGLIVFSLRVPHIFTIPLDISPLFDVIAVASLAGAIAVATLRRPSLLSPAIRASLGLAIFVAMFLVPTDVFLITLPAAWVVAVPPDGVVDDHLTRGTRVLLAALVIANT
ncbi:MAG TPA: hypothetical protein VKE27_06740, partial [Candidatus Dormibacteraeota bacterium]|nr:hypothetical protein [Candidatus Dormibacteraeota bacterium]